MRRNIILADDHVLFRKGLKSYLLTRGLAEEVHEAGNGKEVLNILEKCRADIILLDMRMPVMDGYHTASQVLKSFPLVPIIIVSMLNEEALILNFIKLGVSGYMLKNDDEIEKALETVMLGHFYFSKELQPVIKKAQTSLAGIKPITLTSKESKLLPLLAEGKTSEEIALCLSLLKQTVESYRKDLLARFELNNSAALIDYAHRTGLL